MLLLLLLHTKASSFRCDSHMPLEESHQMTFTIWQSHTFKLYDHLIPSLSHLQCKTDQCIKRMV